MTLSTLHQHMSRSILVEAEAIRTAVAVFVPVLAGQLLGSPTWGITVGLGGLYVALAERPASTVRSMLTAALVVALAAGLGATLGTVTILAVAGMLMIAFSGSLMDAYGPVSGGIGFSAALTFAVSTGLAGTWPVGLERFVQFGIGGLWAILLTLILWHWTGKLSLVRAYTERDSQSKKPEVHQPTWAWLRAMWTVHPSFIQHAARMAVTAAAALLLSHLLNIMYGSWVPITVLVIVKPDYESTRRRAHERLFGSLVGGVIALMLAGLIRSVLVLDILLVVSSVLAFSHLPHDYRRYAIFFTIFIVLLKVNFAPNDWEIALGRIGDTLIGGGLALMAAYLLRERTQSDTTTPA
jgi:hypothetical protein